MNEQEKQMDDAMGADLAPFIKDAMGQQLTTDQGLHINDDQYSLKAGVRGPSLLEDFLLREQITHFGHQRIPERVVHARGAGAHGYSQVYELQAHLTRAGLLQDPPVKTPVFVGFSTMAGSHGSSDLAFDARGFAVRFTGPTTRSWWRWRCNRALRYQRGDRTNLPDQPRKVGACAEFCPQPEMAP